MRFFCEKSERFSRGRVGQAGVEAAGGRFGAKMNWSRGPIQRKAGGALAKIKVFGR